jgi:mannosyl-3-phosphoglycerate phosphatase family protein
MKRILIITDLDGTLLNPGNYSFKAALPALQQVRELRIPLIFCSSKTRAEIEVYRKKLKNHHPFISENGGGVFIPDDYFSFSLDIPRHGNYRVVILGKSYDEIRIQFLALREKTKVKIKGFGDMSAEEIAGLTGLSTTEAALARQRDFAEPFIFQENPDQVFLQSIEQVGLHWTHGRLFHIMGNHDKGKAFDILKTYYQQEGGHFQTIGLGDSLNDLPLLKKVDHPVLIRQQNGQHDSRIKIPGILKTQCSGSEGWHEAVMFLLGKILTEN